MVHEEHPPRWAHQEAPAGGGTASGTFLAVRPRELGDFLRSRRRQADPAVSGFPADRRRTPGLRREELAALSGVTASWITKLEQGTARSVSVDVLDALSRALQLDPVERGHLLSLAGYRDPGTGADSSAGGPTVTTALRALLDALDPNPAYLLDRAWNMIGWNAAEALLFPTLASMPEGAPNLLDMVFRDRDLALLMADHREEQERLVAQFRLQSIDGGHEPAVATSIARLRDASPRFAELWDARDVVPFATTERHFDHPRAGRLVLDHQRLAVLDRPELQLVVYTARPGSDDLRRLHEQR